MNINRKGQWEMYGGINPSFIELSGVTTPSPHTETVRESYTVKTGRKAIVNFTNMHIWQVSAATSLGARILRLNIKKKGGEFITILQLVHRVNNANPPPGLQTLLGLPLDSGDVVEFITSDSSVGGIILYQYSASIIELDY